MKKKYDIYWENNKNNIHIYWEKYNKKNKQTNKKKKDIHIYWENNKNYIQIYWEKYKDQLF